MDEQNLLIIADRYSKYQRFKTTVAEREDVRMLGTHRFEWLGVEYEMRFVADTSQFAGTDSSWKAVLLPGYQLNGNWSSYANQLSKNRIPVHTADVEMTLESLVLNG
jgi:hypothetical protein